MDNFQPPSGPFEHVSKDAPTQDFRPIEGDGYATMPPSLERMESRGGVNQEVQFDLEAMANGGKTRHEEMVALEVDDLRRELEDRSNSGHFLGLRVIRVHEPSRQPYIDYKDLPDLINEKCPELKEFHFDFEVMDCSEPYQELTPSWRQPELNRLTNIKGATIHSQLLLSSPVDMELSNLSKELPPNLETLMLAGLNDKVLQLGTNEQLSVLTSLKKNLPSLKRLGFRYDFPVVSRSDLDETLRNADPGLTMLMKKAQDMGIVFGLYVRCMKGKDDSDMLHMGTDIWAVQAE